jgi:hypothetical protein
MLTNVWLLNVNLEHYGLKPLFAKTKFQNFIWLFEIGHFFCPFSKSQFTFWKKKLKYFLSKPLHGIGWVCLVMLSILLNHNIFCEHYAHIIRFLVI